MISICRLVLHHWRHQFAALCFDWRDLFHGERWALPPRFALKRRRREGGTQGLVISSLLILPLAVLFDVSAIASIGTAVALAIFALITIAHLRMTKETKASKLVLVLA